MPEKQILTVEAGTQVVTHKTNENTLWHDVVNAQITKKIVTAPLSGIEQLDGGWTVAVLYFNTFRVVIPIDEMMIDLNGDGRENAAIINRQTRIANNMLNADIDFIIRDVDEASKSIIASRKDAMIRKRQIFYFPSDDEVPARIKENDIIEARVIAVAEKVVRLEAFGVEVSVRARDMSWLWMVDAAEKFGVGDKVPVKVLSISGDIKNLTVHLSAKEAQPNTVKDKLLTCQRQGKYVGTVTDIYNGTYFIRLDNAVNAVAHAANTANLPGKRDKIGFVVTRINLETQVAEGIITRIIKTAF